MASFCVEQSRWTAGAGGKNFGGSVNPVLAPVAVRTAAKVQKDQGQVWASVAGQKRVAAQQGLSSNTNSSLNETLDAPKVKALSDEFIAALRNVVDGQPDAIGVAVVINGEVQEINLYPNAGLLGKQYLRLLGSYALEAAMQKAEGESRPPSATQLCSYIWENGQQARQEISVANALAAQQAMQDANMENDAVQQNIGILNVPMDNAPLANGLRNVQGLMLQVDSQNENTRRQRAPRFYSQVEYTREGREVNHDTRYQPMRGMQPGQAMSVRNGREEAINPDNRLKVAEGQKAYQCDTFWNGKIVHKQMLARPAAQPRQAPAPRQMPAPVPQQAQPASNANP